MIKNDLRTDPDVQMFISHTECVAGKCPEIGEAMRKMAKVMEMYVNGDKEDLKTCDAYIRGHISNEPTSKQVFDYMLDNPWEFFSDEDEYKEYVQRLRDLITEIQLYAWSLGPCNQE